MTAGLTKKGRATRERIVGAAADLVFEHGPVGTSIEDVRKAAGVSGSQMTHYFRDKRSLIQAVVEWQADVVIAAQQQLDVDRLDSFAGMRRWAELNVQRQVANGCTGGCRLGSLAGELADSDDETRRELVAGFDRWELVLRDALRAMYDRGELRPQADPEKLAVSLLAALQGGLLLTSTKRDPGPLMNALDSALSYIESFAADPASAVRAD
ncbi:MAG TPA: TetR family transcriptional regulator C-terminal domain-containing protein [Kribbella sp.]|uniref:TetR/AcrR family transcriptional regulator n=1 Tax=Kribbella sp. TaxID=1871183 RepID=UPI002D7891C1|nr:TetR family transcriptional regulator C-terminal domain-containing protein [Kribbella sp.]HET6297991.1 TetR family transcriptional regulator C-terminal domain-containing protein [Kribbella sp.]